MDSVHVELEMRGVLDMVAAFLPEDEADAVRQAAPELAAQMGVLAEASGAKSIRELVALREQGPRFAALAELREEYDDDDDMQ